MEAASEEILKRFNESWTETQLFYTNLVDSYDAYDTFIPLLFFLKKLRKAGEDKNFRVGTSMNDLILSRSAEFGLRPDQKFVAVQVKGNLFIISFRTGTKLHKEYRIKDLDDERLTGLLQTLKNILID
jgi:hypothetical protein